LTPPIARKKSSAPAIHFCITAESSFLDHLISARHAAGKPSLERSMQSAEIREATYNSLVLDPDRPKMASSSRRNP
jgi:hypothetical protein